MPVLERVWASTVLTMTAQESEGARRPVREGLARQRARHHHRIGRHLADMDLAGGAVDDLGRGGDEDAHREHRALADDHALDDFRAGADEAVVLDDGRVGLQRLQHAADADAAREMHVLADLGAGADRRPGIDHGAGIDIGADIDEGRHQDHAGREIGARARPPCGTMRKPRGAEARSRPSPRTWRAPCPEHALARGPLAMIMLSVRRKESSTAFFSH